MVLVRFFALLAFFVVCPAVNADDPADLQPSVSPAKATVNPSPQMTDQIQQAMRGKKIETGNGILDDMFDVLQERGSILDGSSLDASLVDNDNDGSLSETTSVGSLRPIHWRAAESLLKSARLLEKIGKLSPEQKALALQMRRMAIELLVVDNEATLE